MSESRARRSRKRRRQRKTLRFVYRAAFLLAALMLIVGIAMFVMANRDVQKQQETRDLYYSNRTTPAAAAPTSAPVEQAPTAPADVTAAPAATTAPELPTVQPEDAVLTIHDDFKELYSVNPEVIGWITAGADIDTPVLLRDNSYYMDHNIYGEFSQHGEAFADEANTSWYTDQFVILYGHNMKNGTVFGSMDDFRDGNYLSQHPAVNFRTLYDDVPTSYVPFSVFDASMVKSDHNYFQLRRFELFSEGDTAGIQAFLDEVLERSIYPIGVEVGVEDRILVLVTCSYDDPDGRMMIFCRELREGEEFAGGN